MMFHSYSKVCIKLKKFRSPMQKNISRLGFKRFRPQSPCMAQSDGAQKLSDFPQKPK